MIVIEQKKDGFFIPSVLLSIGLHVIIASAILLYWSQNLKVSPNLNSHYPIWVDLEQTVRIKDTPPQNTGVPPSSPLQKSGKKNFTPEKKLVPNPSPAIYQIAESQPRANEAPVQNNLFLPGHQTESLNISGQDSNQKSNISGLLDEMVHPLYKENIPPVYPTLARIRGYEGEVILCVEILPNGRVGDVKVKKSSGYAILDQSALDAVKPWKFEPARKWGSPLKVWVDLPIKFILRNENSKS